MTSLHDLVRERALLRPDALAVTDTAQTLTYEQLWDRVRVVGSSLLELGVQRGDRVAILLDKRVETVVSILACSYAGAVFVPVNPVLRSHQVGHILRDCSARLLVTSTARAQLLQETMEYCPSLTQVIGVPDLPATSPTGPSATSWTELEASRRASASVPSGVDADVAAIFYTSGSTGLPKGVVLSHRNLLVGAESVSHYLGNHESDVILAALPLSFDAGFSQLTTAFRRGAHVVLLNYLTANDVVNACARHQVSGLTCVPPLWIQLAAATWPDEARRSLRYFANTGGRMPRPTLARLRAIFPQAAPYLMYGLTEAFRSTYLDPHEVDRRPDSIGKAIPNAEILVVRPDGTVCDHDEPGELVHRGPLVSLGYWNDPDRTRERFRPSPGQPPGLVSPEMSVWSGDTVVRDTEGFLYFVGRSDEMIKTSGYRVSPTEIEEAAYGTGLVRDAVALGLPDERLGHRIELVVSPAGVAVTPEDVLAALRPLLPRYMLPARVTMLPELARSPNGKFDRVALRQALS